MNRKKLLSLAALSLLGSAAAWAQPTLNSSINPQAGQSWMYHRGTTTTANPGPAGANQTWNFSAFTETGSDPIAYEACGTAPDCAIFPGTTVVGNQSNGSAYVYFVANSSEYSFNGIHTTNAGGEVDIVYSDREKQLIYPVSYNDSHTDPWAASFVSGTFTFYRSGSTTSTADAYGTITTPDGTFSNAMRVHLHQVYKDSFNVGGFSSLINYDADIYNWYQPNRREIIYSYSSITTTQPGSGSTTSTASTYANGSAGIAHAPAFAASVRTFPNPATSALTIAFETDQAEHATISLLDMTGRTVATISDQDFAAGSQTVSVDVSKLPAAIYALSIRTADGRQMTRRVQVL